MLFRNRLLRASTTGAIAILVGGFTAGACTHDCTVFNTIFSKKKLSDPTSDYYCITFEHETRTDFYHNIYSSTPMSGAPDEQFTAQAKFYDQGDCAQFCLFQEPGRAAMDEYGVPDLRFERDLTVYKTCFEP